MTRDNILFATCGLLLGLIIGSLIIGPKVAQSKWAKASATPEEGAASTTGAAASMQSPVENPGSAAGGNGSQSNPAANPMEQVRQQLLTLRQTVERDPKNFEALVQLGNLYMDAAKFSKAIDYYTRALAVREEPAVRTDLGICYKQSGQLEQALVAFQQASREAPDQIQPLYNQAIVLAELKRVNEAREVAAQLKQRHPDDQEIEKLRQSLAQSK